MQVVLGRIYEAQYFDVKVGPHSHLDAHCSHNDPSNGAICSREGYTKYADDMGTSKAGHCPNQHLETLNDRIEFRLSIGKSNSSECQR